MLATTLLVTATATVTASCQKHAEDARPAPAPRVISPATAASSPPTVTPARPTVAAAPVVASQPPTLAVTVTGIGPINERSRADVADLQAVLPQYVVSVGARVGKTITQVDLMPVGRTSGLQSVALFFDAERGNLTDMRVYDPTMPGPGGFHVGDALATVRAAAGIRCRKNPDEEQQLVCRFGDAPNVGYAFNGGSKTVDEIDWTAGVTASGVR